LQADEKGSSLFSVEWLGWEAPNPKLQAPEKFQAPNLNAPPRWPPLHSGLVWRLSFGASLEQAPACGGLFHGRNSYTQYIAFHSVLPRVS
jgi:hypothetical protein